ncbi:DUF2064 domain-containing protein [Amycolatopsis halotolerans]|uniref:DUF2064 domain-containing protein n=1 Tax=Amycolatopsis halotolerans TaxID=330083 RepID=A0ABV7QBU5_9PSEU
MTSTTILILAKAPLPGRVKTRLCPPATSEQAAHIAAAALLETVRAVRSVSGAHAVVALEGDLETGISAVELCAVTADIPVLPQRGSSLGERIAAAHADAAALAPGRPVLQIGMDTPQVSAELLEQCRDRLLGTAAEAVLGPADDGGWWLLGLRDPLKAAVVSGVTTSRSDTGFRTRQALIDHGLHVATAPGLRDVDTMADARAVAETMPGTMFAAAVGTVG